ncbi:cyclin-D5-3-like [Rutidosis leptorrhynchoides]|uniref:cyclin-D5-3-like n=1 Tax=Rutidosis leptorrhynchoides TaxID=125765 RepID=UPI003A9A2F4D
MALSSSQSTFSPSRFLSLETVPEDDADEDEVIEHQSQIHLEHDVRFLLEMENDRTPVQSDVDDWIITARSEAIQWIINTMSFLKLRVQTAYLSVMYIDRFMSKGLIARDKHWAIRLLSVACLSLATKMEEREPQPLSAFLIGGYNFDNNQIQRMELLVLSTLNWRLHYITPFHFIQSFIQCFFEENKKHFTSLITQILFAATKDMKIMRYTSSTVAMAVTLTVLDQNLTKESLEIKLKTTWLNLLLNHEDVYTCYFFFEKQDIISSQTNYKVQVWHDKYHTLSDTHFGLVRLSNPIPKYKAKSNYKMFRYTHGLLSQVNQSSFLPCNRRVLELQPVKVNISKHDLVNNPSIGTKRKRLTFGEEEDKPNQ